MKCLSSKILSLVVLAINVVFMIITLTHISREKIVQFAGNGTARTLFFISIILSVAALVYTIIEKKKGKSVLLPVAIINIIIAVFLLLIPSMSLGMLFSGFGF